MLLLCVVMPHHALLGRHQAVPLALRRYAAELLHLLVLGFSVEQAVQGQLRRAVGFRALLFLPRQVVLTHGIVPVNHGGERRRGLLGRHDSAAGRRVKRDRDQDERTAAHKHKSSYYHTDKVIGFDDEITLKLCVSAPKCLTQLMQELDHRYRRL